MDHLISVIVPVFNTDEYLSNCLLSICNQSYQNLEIILVNDGSTDKSEVICHDYELLDCRVKYVKKDINEGLSSARNTGIDLATGQYLSFIDSDDCIHPEFIEILHKACVDYMVDISMCGMKTVNGESIQDLFTMNSMHHWSSEEAIGNLLVWKNIDGSVCNKLFKKGLFDNIRFSPGRIAEDLPVTVNILCMVSSIVHVGQPLYFYYNRTASITNQQFSPQKMSILESASEVRNMVIGRFPHLKEKAASYYYSHLVYLLGLLAINIDKNDLPIEVNYLNSQLRKSIFSILLNRYLSQKKKIKAMLFLSGLYKVIIKFSQQKQNKHN